MDHATQRLSLGGADVSAYFGSLLRKAGFTLHTPSQLDTLRAMKETIGECLPRAATLTAEDDEHMMAEYKMPDGTVLQIGGARHRAAEVLFAPHLMGKECKGIFSLKLCSRHFLRTQILNVHCEGIQFAVNECIGACDVGVRRQLSAHVTLCGGGSVLRGFAQRLVNECVARDVNVYEYKAVMARERVRVRARKEHASKWDKEASVGVVGGVGGVGGGVGDEEEEEMGGGKKTRLRMFAARDRVYSAWRGGSVLCGMDEFGEEMWNDVIIVLFVLCMCVCVYGWPYIESILAHDIQYMTRVRVISFFMSLPL